MKENQLSIITYLTYLLALLVGLASYFGSFYAFTYERETPSIEAQGVGQDLVNLFLVVPVLVISMIYMKRKHKTATFIFGGTVFYLLYSYIIYSFGIHFNQLFLIYCLTLGCSIYLFILFIHYLKGLNILEWFNEKAPIKMIGTYLIVVALMFYVLWLKELIPAILHNTIPESVNKEQLMINPVHVIDISFALPALIISAFMLIKRMEYGFVYAPILMVFIIILTIALAAMVTMLKIRGMDEDPSIAIIFIMLAIITIALLVRLFKWKPIRSNK